MFRESPVPGSARGVRVAGAVWAALTMATGIFMVYAYAWWDGLLLACVIAGFLTIRPWFMGVGLEGESIVVKGWFRNFRIPADDVVSIELDKCMSLLVGFQTGFIPFVGRVRMVTLELTRNDKTRFSSLPGTIGRYKTVLTLVRAMRVHAGLQE